MAGREDLLSFFRRQPARPSRGPPGYAVDRRGIAADAGPVAAGIVVDESTRSLRLIYFRADARCLRHYRRGEAAPHIAPKSIHVAYFYFSDCFTDAAAASHSL